MSADGRIYYIDHNSQRTTWEKPRYLERQPTAEESGAKVGPTEQVRTAMWNETHLACQEKTNRFKPHQYSQHSY